MEAAPALSGAMRLSRRAKNTVPSWRCIGSSHVCGVRRHDLLAVEIKRVLIVWHDKIGQPLAEQLSRAVPSSRAAVRFASRITPSRSSVR